MLTINGIEELKAHAGDDVPSAQEPGWCPGDTRRSLVADATSGTVCVTA